MTFFQWYRNFRLYIKTKCILRDELAVHNLLLPYHIFTAYQLDFTNSTGQACSVKYLEVHESWNADKPTNVTADGGQGKITV